MRDPTQSFTDVSGRTLGLGSGDLIDLRLPAFQRGLKWNDDRVKEFHDSLIQGWPVGVMVMAIQSSTLINADSGQRRITLSLIDGQQRTWALVRLLHDFWTAPWYAFASPKWDTLGPKSGSIADAGASLAQLSDEIGRPQAEMEEAIAKIAAADGGEAFDDYVEFLSNLREQLGMERSSSTRAQRSAARDLSKALLAQREQMGNVEIPVLLLGEALEAQLPSIFRRLNEGVPLKGYDLLAAMWDGESLVFGGASAQQTRFLRSVLKVASRRISDTYPEVGSGYVFDPNLEPLELDDLSLFDLLYFMSKQVEAGRSFSFSSDVLAFQVCAMLFNGSISKVELSLRDSFPIEPSDTPDITTVPRLFAVAAGAVVSALKPQMDVSSNNLTLRGRVGLTAAVVYLSTILTHHNRVVQGSAAHLALKSRGGSAEDRLVRPGEFMASAQRISRLKETLPAWYVHDSLTSVFAGSRAYEAANDRVWKEFIRGTGKARLYALRPSNKMFSFPTLDDMLAAFNRLWISELDIDKTPQRRRVSDGGSVLLRAAFSHLRVHDAVIDHVIPMAKAKAAAAGSSEAFPINHVANLMPLDELINGKRKDEDWSDFAKRLSRQEQARARASLLTRWATASSASLVDRDTFVEFLAVRYRLLLAKALDNLGVSEWVALEKPRREEQLSRVAV